MEMTARALDVRRPLAAGGLLRVADGVTFSEDDERSGSVFLWGMAAWSWAAGDRVARRLAAVQLVETRAARQRQVAAAFGVNEDSLILWRGEYAAHGAAGLAGRRPGPKGPSKLTEAKRDEIGALRAEGLTLAAVAERTGVSTDTVRRALVRAPRRPGLDEPGGEPARAPRSRPADRVVEQHAARAGLITETPPAVCEGPALPNAGALIILPALAATGLLDTAARVYETGRPASSGLRSLMLSMVFSCLLGEPRGPEITARRQRIQELAARGRAALLIQALARRHLETHGDVAGIFYFDGQVRAYHHSAEIARAEVARIRLSTGVEIDPWVLDRNGHGVLVWTMPAEASIVDELRAVTTRVRDLAGPDARPTVWFDRGGWSPKVFAELATAGFDFVTFRTGFAQAEPRAAFRCHRFADGSGRVHGYRLADREVGLDYDSGRRRFACRQLTRLDPRTGRQTQILTTRGDPNPVAIAHATFQGLGQGHLVDSLRVHDLDTVDGDAGTDDDPECLESERRRIHDVVRMSTYNAESGLVRLLAPTYVRADDAARNLLREAFRASADLHVIGDELHVRVNSLSAPARSRAIAALCDELAATDTVYPGTNLALVYSMEGPGRVRERGGAGTGRPAIRRRR